MFGGVKKSVFYAGFICALTVCALLSSCAPKPFVDTVNYKGEDYYFVNFPQTLFYCFYNANEYYEEDVTYPVESDAFHMVQVGGDLYCTKADLPAAESYYSDDANYAWSVTVETDDIEKTYPLQITDEELKYVYGIENTKTDVTLFVDEIEAFGTLMKTSNDGIVKGVTELAFYDGDWYWRSERIDENAEKDGTWPEYVYKLPKSLSDKIYI